LKVSAFITAMLVLPYFTPLIMAQATPPLSAYVGEVKAPACDAVRGDRADGWRAQSRAEVMAPHAMVTTSQPLAAQAGLQIMFAWYSLKEPRPLPSQVWAIPLLGTILFNKIRSEKFSSIRAVRSGYHMGTKVWGACHCISPTNFQRRRESFCAEGAPRRWMAHIGASPNSCAGLILYFASMPARVLSYS
jgi:hypothetical protein